MENNNWQDKALKESGIKAPEWGLEGEETQEAASTVAENRLAELAAETPAATPESFAAKTERTETIRAEIAEMAPKAPEVVEIKEEAITENKADSAWKELREEYPGISEHTSYGEIKNTIEIAHSKYEDHYGNHKRALVLGAITAPVAGALIANAPMVLSSLAFGGGATSLTGVGIAAAATFGVVPMVAPFAILGYGLYKKFKRYQESKIIKKDTALLDAAFSH